MRVISEEKKEIYAEVQVMLIYSIILYKVDSLAFPSIYKRINTGA